MGKHYDIIRDAEGEHYECKHCGLKTDSKGAMLRHHNPKSHDRCPKREWEKEKEEEEMVDRGEVEAPKLEIAGMTPREVVAQHGLEGLELLMKNRLIGNLSSAPGVSKRTRAWIIQQWDSDPTIRRDPNMLYNVLTDSGVQNKIAWRITNTINALFNELAPLLREPAPIFPMMQTPGPQRGFWPAPTYPGQSGYPQFQQRGPFPGGYPSQQFPSQQHPYSYGGYPPERVYTAEDVRKAREEAERDARLKKVEEKQSEVTKSIDDLGTTLSRSINELKTGLGTPHGKVVEEQIPIDKDGNPCDPKEAVSIRFVTRPIEEKRESFIDIFMKLKETGLISTPEKVREIIKESIPQQPVRSPELERIEEKLEEEKGKREDIEKRLEDEKFKRVEDSLEASREEVKRLRSEIGSQPRGQYSHDEFRLLDTTLRKVAEREPVKVVVQFAEKTLLPGTGPPPERTKSPQARGRILEKLREKRLTVPR